MDIGSDGSLCRITSSAKNYCNNIMILKIPDDEQQSSNLTYKLVSIFPDKNQESSSDKSDEDDDDVDDKFEIMLGEMSKNKGTKVLNEKKVSTPKANNSERVEHRKKQGYRTNTDRRNGRWVSHDRINPGTKQYRSSSINNSFKQNSIPAPSQNINPWLVSPFPFSSYPVPSYSEKFQPFNNADPVHGTSSNCDMYPKTMGLLGDSPNVLPPHQFHHNLNNSFPNQNYWVTEDYNSNDYPRPLPDSQTPLIEQGYRKGYQQNQRNKNWSGKRGKSFRRWKRNKVKPCRGRMESNEYFGYHR